MSDITVVSTRLERVLSASVYRTEGRSVSSVLTRLRRIHHQGGTVVVAGGTADGRMKCLIIICQQKCRAILHDMIRNQRDVPLGAWEGERV